MHPYVLYNDQIVHSAAPLLRPGQVGVLSGWGVFTTLRIYDGIPFAFERHYERLSRDAKLLHVALSVSAGELYSRLLRLVDVNHAQEAALRLCIVRSEGGSWAGPGSGNASDIIAMTKSLEQRKDSVNLSVEPNYRYSASPFAGAKSMSWAHHLTLAESAKEDGFDEVVLLNERGEVTECTSANLFAAKDGITRTPPLSCGASPGVTRAVILEELDLQATPVVASSLRLEDLYGADEVFITSTSRELIPVRRLHDRELAGGEAGWPVMNKLQKALLGYIDRYLREHQRTAADPGSSLHQPQNLDVSSTPSRRNTC